MGKSQGSVNLGLAGLVVGGRHVDDTIIGEDELGRSASGGMGKVKCQALTLNKGQGCSCIDQGNKREQGKWESGRKGEMRV